MWTTVCSNKICFNKDKTTEQNLHLRRLFCIRPEINISEPFVPNFLRIRGPQREKRRQIQDQIDKDNLILDKKKLEVLIKNGKYSRYEVEPKCVYPAFRRYNNLKLDDIYRLIRIDFENRRLENKCSKLKSRYDYGEMRKEAEKQEKYLDNILNRPKSIPFTPALNFISIEQLHNRLKKSLIIQQYKRGNSARYTRTNPNNSKINKSNGENNKSGKKTNRSQSSKNKRSLNINNDIENGMKERDDKKVKKETGSTKAETGIKNK